MLPCVAVCCRVLQRVAVSVIDSGKDARGCVSCNMLQYVAVCCRVSGMNARKLQCVAVCCSVSL